MKNSRIIALMLAIVLCVSVLAGCAQPAAQAEPTPAAQTNAAGPSAAPAASTAPAVAGKYTAGTYTASDFGMNGDVVVTMTFDAQNITDVQAVGDAETAGIGPMALEQLPPAILAAQSIDVDTIAGATVTSEALLRAAADCIAQAAGESATGTGSLELTADVLVLGAGAAGLSAAAGAGNTGASVIVLEANGREGGAASISAGHLSMINEEMNARMERNDEEMQAYLEYKEADFPGEWGETLTGLKQQINEYLASDTAGRFDSLERMLVDHYVLGNGTDLSGKQVTLDFALLKEAFAANMPVLDWVTGAGMEYYDEYYKTRANNPVGEGAGLVKALKKLSDDAGAKIHFNTRATGLVVENGKVVGAVATGPNGESLTYRANKGVIIATGGFASNGAMVAQYQNVAPSVDPGVGTTNPPTNIGDGIVMAADIGAVLRDMEYMTLNTLGGDGESTLRESGLVNGKQQLTVNADGVRYVDETGKWIPASAGLKESKFYHVGGKQFHDALVEAGDTFLADIQGRGWCFVADTLEEAAAKAGLNAAALTATVEQFNGYVDAESDPDFGRKKFNGKAEEGPYVIAQMQVACHLTYGGLVVDTDAHVLDEANNAIPGLYAAGDVISGFEGVVHQTGDCLTLIVYYGKKAGEIAVSEN